MDGEQIRKTLRTCQRAVTAEPANVDLRLRLAKYLAALGHQRQAVQELELCAKLLAARGDLIRAISCGKKVLKLDPSRSDILLFLTRHYAHMEDQPRVARPLGTGRDRDATPSATPPAPSSMTPLPTPAVATSTTRIVKMPIRDPALDSIELSVITLGDEEDVEALREDSTQALSPQLLDRLADHVRELSSPPEEAPPKLVRVEIPNVLPLDIHRGDLPAIPVFSSLPPEPFRAVLERLEHVVLEPGIVLNNAGSVGSETEAALKILVSGELVAHWHRDDGTKVELGPIQIGSFFGELEILTGSSNSPVELEVVEETEILVLPRADLLELFEQYPSVRERIEGLHQKRVVRDYLAASDLFESLPVADREILARRFNPKVFRPGEVVGEIGEPIGGLGLVRDGRLESSDADGAVHRILGPGAFFGAHSLSRDDAYLTRLVASELTTVLFLPRKDLRQFLSLHPAARAAFDALAALPPPHLQR